MKKIFFVTSLIAFFSFASSALAQSQGGFLQLPNPLYPIDNLKDLVLRITSQLSLLIGSIAIIVFVWAGILFLTSAGNEAQIGKARKAVLYAVIGLAIALAGQALVQFVQFLITG